MLNPSAAPGRRREHGGAAGRLPCASPPLAHCVSFLAGGSGWGALGAQNFTNGQNPKRRWMFLARKKADICSAALLQLRLPKPGSLRGTSQRRVAEK